MKPKGINFFEQHVEKFVLGVAGLVALGAAAYQFVGQPNAVEVAGQAYAPGEADAVLAKDAEGLQRKLESDRGLEVPPMTRISDWFVQAHANPVGADATMAVALVRPTPLQVGGRAHDATARENFVEFIPEAPSKLDVAVRNYSLDPAAVESTPGLAELVSDGPPYDIPAVHVFAEVNGVELRRQLSRTSLEKRGVPTTWWESDMAILDVTLERQRQLDDGTWSEVEVVPPIPGEVDFSDRIASLRPAEWPSLSSELYAAGPAVYQPGFYRLADGREWSRELVEAARPLDEEAQRLVAEVQRAYAQWQSEQQALNRYLQQKEGRRGGEETSTPKRGPSGPEGGGDTGRGGGRGGERDTSSDQSREDRILAARERAVQEARERYEAAKESARDSLPAGYVFPDEQAAPTQEPGRGRSGPSDYTGPENRPSGPELPAKGSGGPEQVPSGPEGITPKGAGYDTPMGRGETGGRSGRAIQSAPSPLLDNEALAVWAHDVNVVPGQTYRYRMRVQYYNPFFGREARLTDEQQHLASSAAVSSVETEWSEPVRITSDLQFYAVNGSYSESIDDRTATFEIYRFTGGRYHPATVSLKPGEPIGDRKRISTADGGTEEVNFFTGGVLLDVVRVAEGTGLSDEKVRILVALPDGSILSLNPDEQRENPERVRLREMSSEPPRS